jgi:hypothetical protein
MLDDSRFTGNGDRFRLELPGFVEDMLEAVDVEDDVLLLLVFIFTWWYIRLSIL